jgi:exonuclease SbcC
MRFNRLKLENFKCYTDADLVLEPGVTVIYGPNGAGKSSVLEACFFALYGHRALDKTLDDVVTNGTEEARIELWFSHAGREYYVERVVRIRGSNAQTTSCVLEGPDESVDGATDVRARIIELLRMDSEAFVNCAYVRQGEVNKLINASPGDRQDMIDDLLQLGKLEEYRERAKNARLGVKHVRDAREAVLIDVNKQINAKEDQDPYEQLNGLKSKLNKVGEQIESFEAKRDPAENTLENAKSVLEDYREAQTDIEQYQADIAELTDRINQCEAERTQKAETISEHRDTIETLRAERTTVVAETELEGPDPTRVEGRQAELEEQLDQIRESIQQQLVERQEHVSEAETAAERAADLEQRAEAKREEATEREADLESDRERLKTRREELKTMEDRIQARRETFRDTPVARDEVETHREAVGVELTEAREAVAEMEATLNAKRDSVTEAEQLLEEGKCPECGQPVEDSPHIETLEADRKMVTELSSKLTNAHERVTELESKRKIADDLSEQAAELNTLETNAENLQTLIDEQAGNFADREQAIERLQDEAAELQQTAATAREDAESATQKAKAVKAKIGELNQRKSTVTAASDRLDRVTELNDSLTTHKETIERLQDQRANLEEQNKLRREQLAQKQTARRELIDEFDTDHVEHARAEKERAEQYLQKLGDQLQELHSQENELRDAIGGVRTTIDELESLNDRREQLSATVERLESLYDEAYGLQKMYADLRGELRQQNVRRLKSLLNQTFELLYQNDSYARIELDGEYELTVYQKDGEPLGPEQLSGGERAIFNLSLRCAIYRLLAEGIDGETPMPPLILDEPTVFLDSGHVSKLVDLIKTMQGFGVDQILVVSHDDELVGAADDLVTVEKNTTTNRSSVRHEGGAIDAAVLSKLAGEN